MKQKKINKNKLKLVYKMAENASEEEIKQRLRKIYRFIIDETRGYIKDNKQ